MSVIRRILVAVKDPGAASAPAVAKAAQLARALGARLEIFHAISSALYVDAYSFKDTVPQMERTLRRECLAALEKIAQPLRTRGLEVAVEVQWDYPVHDAIIRRARTIKADLIVAARHTRPHLAPALLHLTDWELLRFSPVPVLLVKTAAAYVRPVVLAAIDPTRAFSKPANLDARILETGAAVAAALRGRLHAMHAYIPAGAFAYGPVSGGTIERLSAQTTRQARQRFERALKKSAIATQNRHLVARHPIDAIEDVARETHSGIVVMGAIARSGLKRLIIGNTAETLLDRLGCDVLIVKPTGFITKVQRGRRGARLVVAPAQQLY